MHKKLFFSIFFLLNLVTCAQTGQFFDAPFGGGIGYVPAWYIPSVSSVNNQLNDIGIPELSTNGFYSSGIAGFIYIGFVKNLRIGGMGYSGSVSSTQNVSGVNREVVYNLGGGGVTIEYTLPFIKNLGVSIGAALGTGSLQLDMYRNSGEFNWQGTWIEFKNSESVALSRL